MSLLLSDDDDDEIKPLPRNSSSLSSFNVWFCEILSNSVRYEFKMSLCRVCVWIWAVPLSWSWAILSFNKVNLERQSLISRLIVSYENSLERRGDDSPVPFPDDILLSATSFKSISFSRLRAFLRISERIEKNDDVNEKKKLMRSCVKKENICCTYHPMFQPFSIITMLV